jgi:tetratricopeptide (TPR) repeat protein
VLVALATGATARADSGLAELSARIAQEPGNGALLLRRAALHRSSGDTDAALADLELAVDLPGGGRHADLRAGQILLETEAFEAALVKFGRVLNAEPDDGDARRGQAQALWRLGRISEATTIFAALQRAVDVEPESFQEHADLLMRAPAPRIEAAIAILDAGIRRLGPLPELVMNVVALERRSRRWAAALGHVDLALANSPRRDHWLALRGDILVDAGRPREAVAAFTAAKVALAALPADVQARPDLRRARAALEARVAVNRAARSSPSRRAPRDRSAHPAAAAARGR